MNLPYTTLAPTNLRNFRAHRYGGESFSTSLYNFAPEDVSIIRTLYQETKAVYDLWLYMKDAPDYNLFQANVAYFASEAFLELGQLLGQATYASRTVDHDFKKVVHDVRGGAVTGLISYAQYIQELEAFNDFERMRSFVFLARDQAKMMRNALVDIDVPTRSADERFKIHSIRDYVQKWDGIVYGSPAAPVQVRVRSHYEGNVSTSCLEASTIDRILYNLMNNAIRFSASQGVTLTIFPVGDLIRWVIENHITDEDIHWLQENVGDDLKGLYRGGITHGGTGLGLLNCAEMIAESVGLSPSETVEKGYIGAKIIGDKYYSFFHWPSC